MIEATPGDERALALHAADAEPLIGLGWIWRLRWGALIGQIAALGLAHFVLGILPVWSGLVPALLLLGVSNVARSFPSGSA